MSTVPLQDKITLRNFHTIATLGFDAWSRPSRPQPITLSISLGLPTTTAGISDDLGHSFSYGTMCKDLQRAVEGIEHSGIDELLLGVLWIARKWPGRSLDVEVVAPNALLRCEGGLGVSKRCFRYGDERDHHVNSHESLDHWTLDAEEWCIKGLKCACVIGVNPPERKEKQNVVIELRCKNESHEVTQFADALKKEGNVLWRNMVRRVCDVTEASSFQTLEALAALIAKTCLEVDSHIPRVSVKVEKPSALTFVEGAGVEITRDRNWLSAVSSTSDGPDATSSED